MTKVSTLAGLLLGAALLARAGGGAGGRDHRGYFLEWPMPFEFAKVQGLYEERAGRARGVGDLRHRHRHVGGDGGGRRGHRGEPGRAALRGGDLARGRTSSAPRHRRVAIRRTTTASCGRDLEIDKENAGAELPGKKVARAAGDGRALRLPAADGAFRRGRWPRWRSWTWRRPDGAAAFAQGAVDMFCGYGAALHARRGAGQRAADRAPRRRSWASSSST